MRAPIISILLLLIFFTSCKDSDSNKNNSNSETYTEEEFKTESNKDFNKESISNSEEEQPESTEAHSIDTSTPISEKNSESNSAPSILRGKFIKIGEGTTNSCTCYCVTITYTGNSELCLVPSEISVNTRMEKAGNGKTNVFLVSPSTKNTGGKDIPWETFDTTTPIASITSKANGEMELDWLGFSINGDLAIDYAILGKKALEGTYKKN